MKSSFHMLCGPPWITTNSGYLRCGSKPGGFTSRLWMRLPRLDVNQNSSAGSQSIPAARSVLKVVIDRHWPVRRSTRPSSCGRTALDQTAATTGALPAPPTAIREYVPASSLPTSRGCAARDRHLEQLVVAGALGEEEHATAVGRRHVLAHGFVEIPGDAPGCRRATATTSARAASAVYTQRSVAGCCLASSALPSGVNSGVE